MRKFFGIFLQNGNRLFWGNSQKYEDLEDASGTGMLPSIQPGYLYHFGWYSPHRAEKNPEMSECAGGDTGGDFFKLIFILWDTIFDDF